MTRARERRKQEVWKDDPLVPINVEVLKSVLQERQWGPSELARRVGARFTNQQNISHMLKSGASRKCRASLRRRVAKALDVAEEFLAGEPTVPPYGPFVGNGYEYRYSLRTKLAASRLFTLAAKAVRRDIERDQVLHGEIYARVPNDFSFQQALQWIGDLVLVKHWRQKLIVWDRDVEASRWYTEPPSNSPGEIRDVRPRKPTREERPRYPKGVTILDWHSDPVTPIVDPDHEAGVLALLAAVEHLLRPWFEDKATLNYAGLRDFAHLPNHPFVGTPEAVPSTSPLASWQPQSLVTSPTDPSATALTSTAPKQRRARTGRRGKR